ncbi:hypothetical protein B0H19DRAFT_1098634 [Mycena capillaripes]|nr:hypothetical protein B0H19DRAFT_1098634 [Mycena capillaripes]
MKRVATPSNETPAPKRTKASQACSQCRKQKSRCEILDVHPPSGGPVTIRCHRCKVLGVVCSFETSDLIHFAPKTSQTPTETSPASSGDHLTPTPVTPENYGSLNTLAAVASSRPNAETAALTTSSIPPQRSRPNAGIVPPTSSFIPPQRGMLPEDLVPTATTPVWGSVSRVDWTATPMLAIQELLRLPSSAGLQLPAVGRLSDILSPPEVTSLLEIFETRYSPWLCFQSGPLESSNVLLDIVRCTVASRHLSPATRPTIAPRLQKLTEDAFLREIFNPQPSLESIRALLILSVWTPICGTGAEARDGRLLIASAVSMAMNLHLQNETTRLSGLRAEKDGLSSNKQTELDESTRRWRLVAHIFFFELCIGTGRTPVSHISKLDQDLLSLSSLPHFNLSAIRDIRLGLGARMFQLAEAALKLRLQNAAELGTFFEQINDKINNMEGLGRLVTPLPVITRSDSFYSQMLILQYEACRLLMLHHAIRETRTAHERDSPEMPWHKSTAGGTIAEKVLSTFLTPSDLTLLSSAPDNIYVMVGFSATWIFVSNFHLLQMGGKKLGGASERLQSMTIERLNEIAHAPDHSAARCAHVLSALMSAWERRRPEEGDTAGTWSMLDVPYSRLPCFPFHDLTGGEEYSIPQASSDGATSNPDLFMDDTFWTLFIQNLNSDTSWQNSATT